MFKQENKKYDDYIKAGVTCKIIEHDVPCFTWNTDEKKIIPHLETLQVKPGSTKKFMITYSKLSQELVQEINLKYGIVFMSNHDSVTNNDRAYYRFIIVE